MQPRLAPPFAKRALDLLITVPLLVLLSPVLAAIAIAIKVTSSGPALFRQTRIGLGERPFTMFKFRSMVVSAPSDDSALRKAFRDELDGVAQPENDSFKLHDDPRVTSIGKLLRATSLDEVPQLFNVVKGEMSLVGPRPALDWEHEMFTPEQRRRTDVLPGLTGMWQVNGRSRLATPEMVELDLEYVERYSIWLDIQILFRTIPTLIRGDGARSMRTMFVSTDGGHLSELVAISERLGADLVDGAVWVCIDSAQSRSMLEDRQSVLVRNVQPKDVLNVLRSIPDAHKLHHKWKFTQVISTGSGIALAYLPYLALARRQGALHRECDAAHEPVGDRKDPAARPGDPPVHPVREPGDGSLAVRRLGLRPVHAGRDRARADQAGGRRARHRAPVPVPSPARRAGAAARFGRRARA